MTAWVSTHAPKLRVIRPGVPRLPHVPCMQITLWDVTFSWVVSVPVVRTVASLHLMHKSLMSWVSPCWNWGCGLETTFLYLSLLSGCRGPRPLSPTVPPPTMPPPPRSSLPVGIKRGHPSGISAFMVLNLGDTRGQSTPEAVDLKETPTLALQYFQWIPRSGSHHVDFGQCPRTVRYRDANTSSSFDFPFEMVSTVFTRYKTSF